VAKKKKKNTDKPTQTGELIKKGDWVAVRFGNYSYPGKKKKKEKKRNYGLTFFLTIYLSSFQV